MDDRDSARLVTQMDQIQAAFGGVGLALAKLHQALIEGGVPRRVAASILVDVAREWSRATFGHE